MEYVKTFNKNVTATSDTIVNETLPKKVADLDKLLEHSIFGLRRIKDVWTCSWSSMGIDSSGNIEEQVGEKSIIDKSQTGKIKRVKSNRAIVEAANKLCSEIIEILEYCNTLRMWVSTRL